MPPHSGSPPAGTGSLGERAPRRERNAAATQQRLLDAAEHEFATRGFAGARLRDIADAAGVQPALIHHYFVDKLGLYRAVLERAMQLASSASWKVLSERREHGLEALVSGFVGMLVDFYSAHQSFLSILRHESLLGSASLAIDVVRERSVPVLEAVIALIEGKQRDGEVRTDVPAREIVLAAMSMAVHPFSEAGMVAALMPDCVPDGAAALEQRKRSITALVLGGIAVHRRA